MDFVSSTIAPSPLFWKYIGTDLILSVGSAVGVLQVIPLVLKMMVSMDALTAIDRYSLSVSSS